MSGAIDLRAARVRARVEGTVQGVGFRPYVYRLAREEQLGGFVLNDERGVVLEVDGRPDAVLSFLARLPRESPPLAVVEHVECDRIESTGEREFRIVESVRRGSADALVAPDAATCGDCLAELRDPADRRFRYPFANCTNCGPRFTIVRDVPYDRPATTMAGFAMCPACQAEYDDPGDRRFHAQPNACPACGPRVRLLGADGEEAGLAGAPDAVAAAARRLAAGAVLAVKGIGGYHLACDAADEAAVRALRARKRREDRPFALMVRDEAAAGLLVELGAGERELLASSARPIVLAPRRAAARVARGVAPGVRELGVMLPYAPLHHVLLADLAELGVDALVLTSGNVSDEPIAFRDDDARERLGGIADGALVHDRPIETRTDDSLARVVAVGGRRRPLLLRRSRGYVPASIELPFAAPRPLLACGAQQKATFCLARGRRAWVSHHIGDLEHYPALVAHRDGIEHFERLFAVAPELVAHDLHPDYASTAYALERDGRRDDRRAAPPRAPRGVSRRARPRGPGGGGDLRRLGLRRRRHHLGRGGARRRPRLVRALRVAARRAHARRGRGGARALAHGVRVAGRCLRGGAPAAAAARARGRSGALGSGREHPRKPGGLARDDQHGAALRCRGRALRHPRRRELRRSSCS